MIIFQGQASRLYPEVLSNILNNINVNTEEFHHPFWVKRSLEVINTNNILNGITKYHKHDRANEFLYGVFSSCHLNLEKEDFVFTLINHPVDQVYEAYCYYSLLRGDDLSNVPNERVHAQKRAFDQMPNLDLDQFIDLVLEDSNFSFNFCGINYEPIVENVYGFSNYDYFSYIGKYSHVNHLFYTLNNKFNFNIPYLNDLKQYSFKGDKKKIDRLKNKFKKQIDFYKKLDKIYRYGMSI